MTYSTRIRSPWILPVHLLVGLKGKDVQMR